MNTEAQRVQNNSKLAETIHHIQKVYEQGRTIATDIQEFLRYWEHTPKEGEDPKLIGSDRVEVNGSDCDIYVHSNLDVTFEDGCGSIYDFESLNVLDIAYVAEILMEYDGE